MKTELIAQGVNLLNCFRTIDAGSSNANPVEFDGVKNQGLVFGRHDVGQLTGLGLIHQQPVGELAASVAFHDSSPAGSASVRPAVKQSKTKWRVTWDIEMKNSGYELGGGSFPLAPNRTRFSATPAAGHTPATPQLLSRLTFKKPRDRVKHSIYRSTIQGNFGENFCN